MDVQGIIIGTFMWGKQEFAEPQQSKVCPIPVNMGHLDA